VPTFLKLAENFVERSIGYSLATKAIVNKVANPCNICDPRVESWLYQQLEAGKARTLIPQVEVDIESSSAFQLINAAISEITNQP
jgi:hypothetical protein